MRRSWVYGGLCAVVLGGAGWGCRGFSVASTEQAEPVEELPEVFTTEQASCDPGPSPVRRMTSRDYDNTVRDLFGEELQLAGVFPAEEEMLGFHNNADAQSMSPILVEKYLDAAEAVSARVVTRFSQVSPCDPGVSGAEPCARSFIEKIGERAFRRPLEPSDVDEFLALFRHHSAVDGFDGGIAAVVQVMLQSPEFLYRIERGIFVLGQKDVRQLDSFEIASRLSYFFWGSMPDDVLFEAARNDQLRTEDAVMAHAQRLLADERAKDTVRDFHGQWLGLERIDELNKDPVHFPEFDNALRPYLRAEADALIDEVVWTGTGDLSALFTADYTYLNGPLATFYGVKGVTGTSFKKVQMPEGRSAGVLTQGGLLSVLAKPNQGSPIHRGVFVRERLLCEAIPPPPDNASLIPPDPDPTASTRERFAQHRADPACEGCHVLMDPIGFGFEKFDGVGRYRELENGKPVDDSGEVSFTDIGTFKGLPELGAKLATNAEAKQCVARMWFRFAHGRAELERDRCSLDQLYTRFNESGNRITELMLAITQTPAFRYRNAPEGEQTR